MCGYLHSEDPLFDPGLRALPSVFVVRPPAGPAARWVEANIAYALEESSGGRSEAVSTRLPELLLVEVLRLHLATAPAVERGWVAALRDPVLAPAMALLHAAPQRKWTVAELAAGAAVSRSVLDGRFRQVLGRSPIRYLTEWRMHVAQELLVTTELGLAAIARRVGYESEEAFSRAFKRTNRCSPSLWRTSRSRKHSLRPFAAAAKEASREVRKAYLYANNHFSAKSVANAAILKADLGQPLPGEYPQEMVERYPDLKGLVKLLPARPRPTFMTPIFGQNRTARSCRTAGRPAGRRSAPTSPGTG